MDAKLILKIEKGIIEVAKEYAKDKGQSLSEMVENYLKLITATRKETTVADLSPNVRKLRGILKTESNFNYKTTLTEELSKKYGV